MLLSELRGPAEISEAYLPLSFKIVSDTEHTFLQPAECLLQQQTVRILSNSLSKGNHFKNGRNVCPLSGKYCTADKTAQTPIPDMRDTQRVKRRGLEPPGDMIAFRVKQ